MKLSTLAKLANKEKLSTEERSSIRAFFRLSNTIIKMNEKSVKYDKYWKSDRNGKRLRQKKDIILM